MSIDIFTDDHHEVLREIINIAMGQAGAALAELLDSFVKLSVPQTAIVESNQFCGIIADILGDEQEITAVRQAFYNHLSGEAIAIYGQEGCRELHDLMGYEEEHSEHLERELLLDMTNILIGACLNSISEQLGGEIELHYSAPSILCERTSFTVYFGQREVSWKYALFLKVAFRLEEKSFLSHVLVFMPEESIERMRHDLDKWIEVL